MFNDVDNGVESEYMVMSWRAPLKLTARAVHSGGPSRCKLQRVIMCLSRGKLRVQGNRNEGLQMCALEGQHA